MTRIFSSAAPAFWAKGIPVVPLYSKEKRPAIAGWQRYGAEMPTADEQAAWLNAFLKPVAEEARIPDFANVILANERHLIAWWAVEGYKRLKENGTYTEPASHKRLRNQLANRLNPVRYFLSECVNVQKGGQSTLDQMYETFFAFAIGQGVSPRPNRQTFRELLQDLTTDYDFRILDGVKEDITGVVVDGLAIIRR